MATKTSFVPRGKRSRTILAGGFALSVLAFTGAGVYASLAATATGTSNISSGKLSLTVGTDSPSAGFPQTVSNMAPGDTANVLLKLNNNGSINNSGSVTLGASVAASTLLDSSPTKGLQVTMTQCSQAWTGYTPGVQAAPTCGGTATTLLAATPLSTVVSGPVSLNNVSGLTTAGSSLDNILFTVTLPNQSETTTNGVVPANSIQSLSDTVTWSFNQAQRAATNTNG
jgi:hypothetical protein